jgi:hypothetical protein
MNSLWIIILAGAMTAEAVGDSRCLLPMRSQIVSRADGPVTVKPKTQAPSAARQPAVPKPAYSPFDAATLAPSDVTAYIHVDHAADLRRQLAHRPIAQWIEGLVAGGESSKAWTRLARSADLSDAELFDFVLGERFTLLVRANNGQAKQPDEPAHGDDAKPKAALVQESRGAAAEWALVTGVDQAKAAQILRRLKVRVLEPRVGFAIAELPEEDVLIARDEHHLVVGPVQQSKLFYDVLPRIGANNARSLAAEPCMRGARSLGGGNIALFVRHTSEMGGGFSLIVGNLAGDHVAIQHSAHFDQAPFHHAVTKLTCDCSPVKAFESRALVAMIQPTDIGEGPLESFIAAMLHDSLISRDMRRNLGDRRLMVVGEEDGRQLDQPAGVLVPTLVTCIELRDKAIAGEQLDRQMVRLAKHINDVGQGTYLVEIPQACRFSPGEPRHVDLSPAMEGLAGGFPIMKSISLNWTIADGPSGAWFVIGSHRQSMDDVVKTIQAVSPHDERLLGKFDCAGCANGMRIGRHIENWRDQAKAIAPPDKVETFRLTLKLMSQLAAGVQTCHWQLSRPTPQDMRLDVQATLTPPESARSP